jgi:hypothetical protein
MLQYLIVYFLKGYNSVGSSVKIGIVVQQHIAFRQQSSAFASNLNCMLDFMEIVSIVDNFIGWTMINFDLPLQE